MYQKNTLSISLTLSVLLLVSFACIGCSKTEMTTPAATSEQATDSATPSPAITAQPTPTATPTMSPAPTPKPDYVLFENEKVRVTFMGIWPVEAGVSSDIMKFQVDNFTNDYYIVSVDPEFDLSGVTTPEDGVITVGEKEYRAMTYETTVVDGQSSQTVRLCALDRNALIQIPTDGSIDSIRFTLYFTSPSDTFNTDLLTIDLLNPKSASPAILTVNTTDFLGQPINAETIQSKRLTLVNFWATWCHYCVEEMPDLSTIAKEYADKGVGFIGVLIYDEGNIEGAKEFVQTSNIYYPNVVCEEVFAHIAYNQLGLPVSFFFDRNGEIVSEPIMGKKSYEEWKAIIDELLNQVP